MLQQVYSTPLYRKHERAFIIASLIVAALIIPHKSTGSGSSSTLVFDRATLHQASVMYLERNAKEVYAPSKKTIRIIVTSYNSVPEQTDSTPFITAMGTQTRDGIVATNYLPFGTKVRFPDIYGGKVFIVEDRMNARYNRHVDIWSPDLDFSKKFGARYLRMEIL